MRYIKEYPETLAFFEALGSEIRVRIMETLISSGRMSMNDLARITGITNGALTPHMRKLEAAGLVRIVNTPLTHGNQKMYEHQLGKTLIALRRNSSSDGVYHSHLRAGQYSSCEVYPTCGLAHSSGILGEVDDPRYFTHQNRFEADILWFTKGYVEYLVPCVIPADEPIRSLSVKAELSSEAPGSNSFWPSDIHFYINGILIGIWTSPGDFADVRGTFTPDWWFSNWNQYGLLKTITVSEEGTFLDNVRISDVTIRQLHLNPRSPVYFRIGVPETARHIGGLTIFGRDFGNYNQDIEFTISYGQ